MSQDPYILITSDTHAGGSHAQYREYLDPQYREKFDEWRGGTAASCAPWSGAIRTPAPPRGCSSPPRDRRTERVRTGPL